METAIDHCQMQDYRQRTVHAKKWHDPKREQPKISIPKCTWQNVCFVRNCAFFIFLFTAKRVTSCSKYFGPGRALFFCISVLLLIGFCFLTSRVNFFDDALTKDKERVQKTIQDC